MAGFGGAGLWRYDTDRDGNKHIAINIERVK